MKNVILYYEILIYNRNSLFFIITITINKLILTENSIFLLV